MNASYQVSAQKARAILRKIATPASSGGFGGAITENGIAASAASISAVYRDGEIEINSALPAEKIEKAFNL